MSKRQISVVTSSRVMAFLKINFFYRLCAAVIIIYLSFSQLWLTCHPRSTVVVLLDTGIAGTSREIYSEDADDGTGTRNTSVINPVL